MNHLWVFVNFIILLIGMWVIFYSYQINKNYSYSFLKPLLYFLVFSNLIVLVSLFTYYCCAAMFGNCLLYRSTIYMDAIHPFGSIFLLGRTIVFIWLVFAFQNITVPAKIKKIMAYSLAILAVLYLFKYVLPINNFILENFVVFNRLAYFVTTLSFYSFLLYFVVRSFLIRSDKKAKMVSNFAVFFLVGHLILISTRLLSGNERLIVVFSILFLFNIFPLVWFKYYFLPFHEKTSEVPIQSNCIENIYEKHKISKREQEIADLILEGKSNKEIQNALFISLHTVKNHIYNLYQKLGVKSRGQLVHLILESQRRL
jgi:DNA-binding CsgD family transcriptional regulator